MSVSNIGLKIWESIKLSKFVKRYFLRPDPNEINMLATASRYHVDDDGVVKEPLTTDGGTMSGSLDMGNNNIDNANIDASSVNRGENLSWNRRFATKATLPSAFDSFWASRGVTMIAFGDSIRNEVGSPAADLLDERWGKRGEALAGVLNSGGGVLTTSDFTRSPSGSYHTITSSDARRIFWIGASNSVQTATESLFYSNRYAVYFVAESGAGEAKIEYTTDGSTWNDVTIANGASSDLNAIDLDNSGSTAGFVSTFTMSSAARQIAVSANSGTIRVLGVCIEDTTQH